MIPVHRSSSYNFSPTDVQLTYRNLYWTSLARLLSRVRAPMFYHSEWNFLRNREMSSHQMMRVLLISPVVLQAINFDIIRICFPSTSLFLLCVGICLHVFTYGFVQTPHKQAPADFQYLVLYPRKLPFAFVNLDSLPLFGYTSLICVWLHLPSKLPLPGVFQHRTCFV